MLVILNCIDDESPRRAFDEHTAGRLAALAGDEMALAHLAGEGPLPTAEDGDRLLISGSELSASRRNPRDDELFASIQSFLDAGRPVLGICYGHQMLARLLGGDEACRRSATPEFGWKRLAIEPANPLFEGIDDLVSAHSHYDEVQSVPESCEVIARTDRCAVQAFQIRERPVWGVQFHPEIQYEQGEAMFARNLENDPAVAAFFRSELEGPDRLAANDRLFRNFFAAS